MTSRVLLALPRLLAASLLLMLFAFAAPTFADVPAHSTPLLLLPQAQLWALGIGLVMPLAGYVLNHVGPWVSEPVKAAVHVILAAGVTALYTALDTNVIGFNAQTLQMLLTAVLAAAFAHGLLWKPSGVAVKLGAGSNMDPAPKRSRRTRSTAE